MKSAAAEWGIGEDHIDGSTERAESVARNHEQDASSGDAQCGVLWAHGILGGEQRDRDAGEHREDRR